LVFLLLDNVLEWKISSEIPQQKGSPIDGSFPCRKKGISIDVKQPDLIFMSFQNHLRLKGSQIPDVDIPVICSKDYLSLRVNYD